SSNGGRVDHVLALLRTDHPLPPTPVPYTTLFRSRAQYCQSRRAVLFLDLQEPGGGAIERLVPRRFAKQRQDIGPGQMQLRILRGVFTAYQRHRQPLWMRSEEHTSELQSRENLVCRLLLEKTNMDAA